MEAAGNNQAYFPEANGHLHPIISFSLTVPDDVLRRHTHAVRADQACSVMVQCIKDSIDTIWSIVRRFDSPHVYRLFLDSCRIISGDGRVGTVREVGVVTGVPALNTIERLEVLNDENHVISFRVLGGVHRLRNYRSVTTLQVTEDGNKTVVVESYVVDVPERNTREETCIFADFIVKCNLQLLDRISNYYERYRIDVP